MYHRPIVKSTNETNKMKTIDDAEAELAKYVKYSKEKEEVAGENLRYPVILHPCFLIVMLT